MTPASTVGILRPTVPQRRVRRIETPTDTPAAGGELIAFTGQRFERHCEDEFLYLARNNPHGLAEIMRTDLRARPELLTFAAEALGKTGSTPLVVEVLIPLLERAEAVIREGAIYGLVPHLSRSMHARETLRTLLQGDPSPAVRAAAAEALSDFE